MSVTRAIFRGRHPRGPFPLRNCPSPTDRAPARERETPSTRISLPSAASPLRVTRATFALRPCRRWPGPEVRGNGPLRRPTSRGPESPTAQGAPPPSRRSSVCSSSHRGRPTRHVRRGVEVEVKTDVDDDARGAKRLIGEVAELVTEVREVAQFVHESFGVERPALGVARCVANETMESALTIRRKQRRADLEVMARNRLVVPGRRIAPPRELRLTHRREPRGAGTTEVFTGVD